MKPNRNLLVITAVIVLAVMTAIALYLTRQNQSGNVVGREVQSVESVAGQAAPAPVGSITAADVTIPPEMLKRIGLKSEPAAMSSFNEQLRTAGMVQPSAYRETRINPLVGGRVTEVKAQLGDYVKEGQIIARIFSSELAEAQMQYLTVFANLDFHIKQDKRYESLANLGAISKQEQEEVHAKLLEHHAEHAALREKMKLYGLTDGEINALKDAADVRSEVPVHSPSSGVITARNVNPGQVVTHMDSLFSVTDLSAVWVIAQIYEKDFPIMRIGTKVTITSTSLPGRTFHGTISYIDPKIVPETRTAQARIEVANPGQALKIGTFADVLLNTSQQQQGLTIPKSAIQSIGTDQMVFVPAGEGRFQLRKVITGEESGDRVRVLSGVNAGEQVVTEGSFFLRAEMARRSSGQ